MKEFTIYIHNHILYSLEALLHGDNLEDLNYLQKIPIITMMAFAYEALANHDGEEILSVWKKEVEPKMSPLGKLLLLAEIKGKPINVGIAPYQSCSQILNLRNCLAHPKTEKLEIELSSDDPPYPNWKERIDKINIKKSYEDLIAIFSGFPKL